MASSSTAGLMSLYFNSDTTTSNYGAQFLNGSGSSVGANRATRLPLIGYSSALNNYCFSDTLIFAKSGFIRPLLCSLSYDVSSSIGYVQQEGQVWGNTVDEITGITALSAQTNGFAAGSQFDLYGLYPNG